MIVQGGGPDSVPIPDVPLGPVVDGVRLFVRAVEALDRLPFGDSAIQRANRRAARAAGYTGDRATLNAIGQGLRTPEFGMQSQDRGQLRIGPPTIAETLPVPARPTFPAGTLGNPNLPIPSEPPVYGGPPEPPGGWNPGPIRGGGTVNPPAPSGPGQYWPLVVGNAVLNATLPDIIKRIEAYNDILGAVFDTATRRPQPPIPKGPRNPRVPPGQGNPFPPAGPDNRPVVIVNTPPARAPYSERVQQAIDEIGAEIIVSKKRLPIPAPVPAAPPKVPLWLQIAPLLATPLLNSLTSTGGKKRPRLQDPLTQPPLEVRNLTTNTTTLLGSSPWGGGSGVPGTNTCLCKEPPKKRRKKKRTVCYSGTYIERADGTRKTKRRKVKCL